MLCGYHRPYLGFIIKPSHWLLDSEYTYCNNNVTALAHTLFVFLSCFSKTTMSSFRIFTISVGFLCDLLNKGIFSCIEISSNMGCYKQTKNMNKKRVNQIHLLLSSCSVFAVQHMLIKAVLAGTMEGDGNTERRDTDPDFKELTVWGRALGGCGVWGGEISNRHL